MFPRCPEPVRSSGNIRKGQEAEKETTKAVSSTVSPKATGSTMTSSNEEARRSSLEPELSIDMNSKKSDSNSSKHKRKSSVELTKLLRSSMERARSRCDNRIGLFVKGEGKPV